MKRTMEVNQLLFTFLVLFSGIGIWHTCQMSGWLNIVVAQNDYEMPKARR